MARLAGAEKSNLEKYISIPRDSTLTITDKNYVPVKIFVSNCLDYAPCYTHGAQVCSRRGSRQELTTVWRSQYSGCCSLYYKARFTKFHRLEGY